MIGMTSRQRVRRAIHFDGPDRIPHYLPDGGANDILWLWPPPMPDRHPWTDAANGRQRRVDCWGSTWETMGGGSFGETVAWPITDISLQQEYVLPDLNDPRRFQETRDNVASNNASDNPKYCLAVMPFAGLFEGAHKLAGFEKMLEAFHGQPTDLKAFITRLGAAQRQSIRRLAECGCDGVMGYDDWGLQDRLMVSPALFEEFFLPHYRSNWGLAHELGMDAWLHSCGYIIGILPMLVEAGLNVIQMDQQENMGLERLNEVAGGKLAFWCPVDIQQTMVRGSIDDIRSYVRRMMATIGSHNGGLISMAYSTPEAVNHTPEKIAAMCEAFRACGVYERR
jgi:hypothetical protein